MKLLGSGVLKDETGKLFGILFELMNGWHIIWSKVSRFEGSTIKILEIRFFALWETLISSLNVY